MTVDLKSRLLNCQQTMWFLQSKTYTNTEESPLSHKQSKDKVIKIKKKTEQLKFNKLSRDSICKQLRTNRKPWTSQRFQSEYIKGSISNSRSHLKEIKKKRSGWHEILSLLKMSLADWVEMILKRWG